MRIRLGGYGFTLWEVPFAVIAFTMARIFGGRTTDYLLRTIVVERDGLTWLWRPRSDDFVGFYAKHEPLVTKLIVREFRSGDVFFDIGSHVGRYAVRASRKGMKVHAWEPDSYNRFGLGQNLRMNNLHATVHPEALGKTDGYLFFQHAGAVGHVVQNGLEKAEVKRLDAYNIPGVDLVKIDTEGFELPILRGATDTLKKNRPRLILELHTRIVRDRREKCIALLKTLGYSQFVPINDMDDEYLFCS